MKTFVIYHGSNKVIDKPYYRGGKKENDYGHGFYCTANIELAKEWACSNKDIDGYVNKYSFDTSDLKVLDLTSKKYSILNWIAILLKHRTFDVSNEFAKQAKEYLLNNFYIDVEQYDFIIGYRADDSYFSFAKDFVNNSISIQQLSKAMVLGDLGKQVVIISQKAYDKLIFDGYEVVNEFSYYIRKQLRDYKARIDYLDGNIRKNTCIDDLFIIDIIRRGLKHGDVVL